MSAPVKPDAGDPPPVAFSIGRCEDCGSLTISSSLDLMELQRKVSDGEPMSVLEGLAYQMACSAVDWAQHHGFKIHPGPDVSVSEVHDEETGAPPGAHVH